MFVLGLARGRRVGIDGVAGAPQLDRAESGERDQLRLAGRNDGVADQNHDAVRSPIDGFKYVDNSGRDTLPCYGRWPRACSSSCTARGESPKDSGPRLEGHECEDHRKADELQPRDHEQAIDEFAAHLRRRPLGLEELGGPLDARSEVDSAGHRREHP